MTILCVVSHIMKRGSEPSVAVASRVSQMAGGQGFTFNFGFGKFVATLFSSAGGNEESRLPRKFARSQWSSTNRRGIFAFVTRRGVHVSLPVGLRRRQ